MPKITQVIVSDDLRGSGKEETPYYRAIQLFTLDGRLICESGPEFDPTKFKSPVSWVVYDVLASLK